MDFPELPEKHLRLIKELKIRFEDISEHHTTGSGPGGQHVNRSMNCVELHHAPTGIDVRMHRHRSLTANRRSGYKLLIMKIEDNLKKEESERAQKTFKIRKQKQRRSRKAKKKMLEEKRQRSEIKETRKKIL